MRGLVSLGVVVLGCSTLIGVLVGQAVHDPMPDLPAIPCDICDTPITVTVAHRHHHTPGCGIDHPSVEHCRCDPWLCPACCPCDVLSGVEG